jgi:hypothetical protein
MLGLQKQPTREDSEPTHTCPIDGCTVQLGYGQLMCRPHWFQAPLQLRRQVVRAWRQASRRQTGWLRYLEIRQSAVDAVQAKVPPRPLAERLAR